MQRVPEHEIDFSACSWTRHTLTNLCTLGSKCIFPTNGNCPPKPLVGTNKVTFNPPIYQYLLTCRQDKFFMNI